MHTPLIKLTKKTLYCNSTALYCSILYSITLYTEQYIWRISTSFLIIFLGRSPYSQGPVYSVILRVGTSFLIFSQGGVPIPRDLCSFETQPFNFQTHYCIVVLGMPFDLQTLNLHTTHQHSINTVSTQQYYVIATGHQHSVQDIDTIFENYLIESCVPLQWVHTGPKSLCRGAHTGPKSLCSGYTQVPSPSVGGHTQAPSPSVVGHTQAPSLSVVGHIQAPSPSVVGHTQAPSPSVVGHTQAPSPSVVGHTQAPSPSVVGHTQAPSPFVVGIHRAWTTRIKR